MLKHFRRKGLWDKGDHGMGGGSGRCEMASDSIWLIKKWPLLSLVGKHMKLGFIPHSLRPYLSIYLFFYHVLLWEGSWEPGRCLPFPWVLSVKFRHTPGAPQLQWKILRLCWRTQLTRLAVGLIFFVSTFFSDVNLLTDSWAIFNLKLKQGVRRGEEKSKEEKKTRKRKRSG